MKHLRGLAMFVGGLLIVVAGIEHQDVLVTFFGFALLGGGWIGVLRLPGLALPGQGHNPRPGLGATAQARSYELELVEEDEASQIRCVVMEFMHRPLTEASVELLEADIELALKRGDLEFSTVLAGGRQQATRRPPPKPSDAKQAVVPPYVNPPAKPAINFEDVPIYDERGQRITVKEIAHRHKEAGVSPMAQKIRYDQLDYRDVLIVNGSEDPIADAGYEAIRKADLVVAVKGDERRVVKDRFGPVGVIDSAQLAQIREAFSPTVIQA